MTTELIDVLDSDGFFTGQRSTRYHVHREGLYHRAVHIYFFDPAGRILLQQRSSYVDHYPNTLSISVTGHIQSKESGSNAAKREIYEELGIASDNYSLEFLFSVKQEAVLSLDYIDKQFNDVFLCRSYSFLPELKLDSKEVSSVSYFDMDTFINMVEKEDARIAPVYKRELNTLLNYIN